MTEQESHLRRWVDEPGPDTLQYVAGIKRDVKVVLAALDQARAERDERQQALTTLRDAWNAHFAYCLSPMPGGITWEQIEEWKNAPSNTVSAESKRASTLLTRPRGDTMTDIFDLAREPDREIEVRLPAGQWSRWSPAVERLAGRRVTTFKIDDIEVPVRIIEARVDPASTEYLIVRLRMLPVERSGE